MSKKAEEYDPIACITAGELRATLGVKLDERVPDCAWVPKTAIEVSAGEVELEAGGRLSISMYCSFSQPFRWVVVHVAATIG